MKRLYPAVPRNPQCFKKVKQVTVPNQSMSLREILQRFTRKESLPISKEGVYNEDYGDLEKMAHEDPVIQAERIAELKDTQQRYKTQETKKQAAEQAAKLAAEQAAKPVDAPLPGATTIK